MPEVTIGEIKVGPQHSAYVIAEVGANHDRHLKTAHQLIDIAADCGANAVKFQTYRADTLYSRFTPRFKEMDEFGRSPGGETPHALILRLELPREWHVELRDHAVERGLHFLSTPFDLEAVEEIAQLHAKAFKIASYDITYYELLRRSAGYHLPMIISTGNSDIGDIELALNAMRKAGNDQIILLHCVSQYPAKYEELNLRVIPTLAQAFQVPIGFSDHTMEATAAVAAVALGACCFEKHFTLDRNRKGPDHPSSLNPDEFAAYVLSIRNAQKALGSAIKRVQPSEEENHRMARRSIHAKVDIPKGTVINSEMLIMKRPALGVPPALEDLLIGRTAKKDIRADEWIEWEMIL